MLKVAMNKNYLKYFFLFFLGVIVMSNIWTQEIKLTLEADNEFLICGQETKINIIVNNNSDVYCEIPSGFFFSAINRLEVEYIDSFNIRGRIESDVFLRRTTKNFQNIRMESYEEKNIVSTATFARGENYTTDFLELNYNGYILDFGIKGVVFFIPMEAERIIISTKWEIDNQIFESNKLELIVVSTN